MTPAAYGPERRDHLHTLGDDVGPSEAVLERQWWGDAPMNDALFVRWGPSRNLWVCGAPRPEVLTNELSGKSRGEARRGGDSQVGRDCCVNFPRLDGERGRRELAPSFSVRLPRVRVAFFPFARRTASATSARDWGGVFRSFSSSASKRCAT